MSFHLGPQLVVSLGSAALLQEHSGAVERPEMYLEFLRPLLGRESIVWADRAETTRRWRLYQQGFSEECRVVYRQVATEVRAAGDFVVCVFVCGGGDELLLVRVVARCS